MRVGCEHAASGAVYKRGMTVTVIEEGDVDDDAAPVECIVARCDNEVRA